MQAVRISEDGWRQVIAALEESAHTCADSAAWLGGAALGQAALGLLSGFGLAPAPMNVQLDSLVVRMVGVHGDLGIDHELTVGWGEALLGSQTLVSRVGGWQEWLHRAAELGDDLRKDDLGNLAQMARDFSHGRLAADAKRWAKLGSMHQTLFPLGLLGVDILGAVVGHFNKRAGELVQDAGDLGSSALVLSLVNKYGKDYAKHVPGLSLFSFAAVAISVNELRTTDYHEMHDGDAEHHSHATRQVIYGTEVGDTLADAALAIAPKTGEAAPFIAGGAAILMGVDAGVRGTIAITDWFHHRKRKAAQVKPTAATDWPPLRTQTVAAASDEA